MTYQYKGKGFYQLTGKNSMKNTIQPLTAAQFNSLNGASMSPVTITSTSGTSGLNLIGAASQGYTATFDFESFGKTHELLKKYEVYESSESILVLSVAARRILRNSHAFYKITDRELFSKITPEDRALADTIKDYYSKNVMMWKLKGNGKLSPFREDMNKLIHSDMLTFKENMIGIAYWLPYFYEYDVELDTVKRELTTNQNFADMDQKGKPGVLKITEDLIPLKRLERKTKRSKYFEYWFKDTQYNAGVVIHLEEKNQLQHLWDTLYNNEKVLKVAGRFHRRNRDGFEYYSVDNWKLA